MASNLDRMKALAGADGRPQKIQELQAERAKINAVYDQSIKDLQVGKQLDEGLFSALAAAVATVGKIGAKTGSAAIEMAKKASAGVKELYLDSKAKIELKQLQKGLRKIILDVVDLEKNVPTLLTRDKDMADLMVGLKKDFEQFLTVIHSRRQLNEEIDGEEDDDELDEASLERDSRGMVSDVWLYKYESPSSGVVLDSKEFVRSKYASDEEFEAAIKEWKAKGYSPKYTSPE